MSDEAVVILIVIIFVVAFIIFLILREFVCWYWKINRFVALEEERNSLLSKMWKEQNILLSEIAKNFYSIARNYYSSLSQGNISGSKDGSIEETKQSTDTTISPNDPTNVN